MPEAPLRELSRPHLAPHARLKRDQTRGRWVLLLPERVLLPDEIAIDVLKRCDGATPLGAIIDALAAEYGADREIVAADVTAMLNTLRETGAVQA